LFGVVLIAGGKSVSIQSPRPSANPPTKTDPIRLASATIQAVDRIGEATSEEIDITADEIMRGATEIAEKLQELANAIREHSKIASEHVTEFCEKATSVFDGIRELQQRLEVDENGAKIQETEDEVLPVPVFLKNGPAASDEHAARQRLQISPARGPSNGI
jgi:hypothetical protein